MIIELLIIIFTFIVASIFLIKKPNGIPPGEWGLPVVGYIPFVNRKFTKTLHELEKKHGKIFSVKLGSRLFIVLTDYSLIKTAYNKPEISGRPSFYGFEVIKKFLHLGVVTSDGQNWTTNRRFAIKTLKDFGLGKSKLDEMILTEADHLVKDLRTRVGEPFQIDWNINVAVLNVIWRLVADRRYDINDKLIKEFAKFNNENHVDIEGPMVVFNLFPSLVHLVPKFIKDKFMRVADVEYKREQILKSFVDIIEEHKKTLDSSSPRDYIDTYLIEREQQKNNPDYSHWGDSDLLMSVYEFFLAGSETTSSTLRWFFLYMAKFPQVQKRIQDEIDHVLPRDQLPSMAEKPNMPCLEALSYEIGRIISLLPTVTPHEVTEETTLEGYTIPKGSICIFNMESCHKNPKYWDHPNDFALENFLDSAGNFVPKKEGYLPFSVGRRQCVGEPMAKMELFIFMGAVLQNFDILEPEGRSLSLAPADYINLFNFPPKFEIVLQNRK